MKLIYIECNEGEMRANRTFMDALTDVVHFASDAIIGSGFPIQSSEEGEDDENNESERG